MSDPILARRRPAHDRVLRRSFGDQVPPVIEAYTATLIAQALEATDEGEHGNVLERIREGLSVHHVARRDEFEQHFLSKRASPCEVKPDWSTQRVYLVGIGLPGREELTVTKVPIKDRYGNTQYYAPETHGEQRDDTVLCYTEVTWAELLEAEERVEKLDPQVAQALCKYFGCQPYHLSAAFLALPSYRDEDFYGIALYALDNS
jgi:hypothetical protein